MMLLLCIFYFAVSFILVKIAIGTCLKRNVNFGLVAQPNEDVITHNRPIPIFGGLFILLIGIPLSAIVLYHFEYYMHNYFLGMVPIFLLGFYKDKIQRPFSPILQFIIQASASYFLYLQWISVNLLEFDWASLAIFVLIASLLMNAYNFLDVADGLAGSYSSVLFLVFALVGLVLGLYPMALISLLFFGANMAFLTYNWNPARLFLGDTGSYGIMYTLLFISIMVFRYKPGSSAIGFLLIFFVPIFELVFTVLRRMVLRKLPHRGDANHASLLLLNKGWRSSKIAYFLIMATFVTSGLGLFLFFG